VRHSFDMKMAFPIALRSEVNNARDFQDAGPVSKTRVMNFRLSDATAK